MMTITLMLSSIIYFFVIDSPIVNFCKAYHGLIGYQMHTRELGLIFAKVKGLAFCNGISYWGEPGCTNKKSVQ